MSVPHFYRHRHHSVRWRDSQISPLVPSYALDREIYLIKNIVYYDNKKENLSSWDISYNLLELYGKM
jgi:hypothetical protein